MKKMVLYFLIFSCFSVHAIFEYDRAISAAQKGDVEKASHLLQSVDIDRPELLYDKGVVAYRQKDLQTAKQHFVASAEHPEAAQDLIERAYFNAGNVSFALKDLADARDRYKKVLDINPDNSFAEHNLKKVEEILKEQKEQKKEDDKKEEKKDDTNKKNDQHKQDQKQNESSPDQKRQEQESQKQENKQDTSEQENQSQQDKQQQEKEHNGNEENASAQQEEHNNAGQKQSKQEQQGPDEQKAQQKHGRNANEQKNKNGAPQQMKGGKKEAEDPATHDEWLAALLDKSDKRDAQENKKMIKAFVKQQMGGNEGQNCW